MLHHFLFLMDREALATAGLLSLSSHEGRDEQEMPDRVSEPQACPVGNVLKVQRDAVERTLILDALMQNRWLREETADALGWSRTTLYLKMKRFKISDELLNPDRHAHADTDSVPHVVEQDVTAMTTDAAERRCILQHLRQHGGRKGAAANALGITRTTLYRKMREYRISLADMQGDAIS